MIFAFFSTKESSATNDLKGVLEEAFEVIVVADLKELAGLEFDYLVCDLDIERKNEKPIKKIKEDNPAITLIYLSNNLGSKELIKHQESKFGGDIYLRTPVDLNSLMLILDLEVSDTPSLPQELMVSEEAPEPEMREIIPELPSEDIEMANDKKDLDLDFDDELDLTDLSSEELIEGTSELSLSNDFDLSDEGDEPSLDGGLSLLEEDELEVNDDNGLDLSLDDSSELALGDDDLNLSGNDEELSLGELDLSGGEDLDLSSNELDLGSDDELDLGSDDGLDLGADDGLDLGADDGLDLGADDGLDLGADDELDFGTDDGLDFSNEEVVTSSVEDDLGLSLDDDLGDSSGDELGLDLSEEIEEESVDDLFATVEESNDEPLSFDSLDEEVSEEDDGLDLFGELPSSPEIDALNLDDDDSSSMSLSEDALKKLQEIDEIMMDESNPKDVTKYLDEASETSATASRSLPNERAVVEQHAGELDRLGLTIRQMREDRSLLLEDLARAKQVVEEHKRENLTLRAELDEKKIENSIIRKRYEKQVEELKYQLDLSNERKGFLEQKNKEFETEFHKMNQKIRLDVKKIQTRERELESQVELMRADSEIQMKNRDQKILELKRKIDTLEFDLESIQVNEKRSTNSKHELEDKMERVVQTLRLAIGELENSEIDIRTIDKLKKNLDV